MINLRTGDRIELFYEDAPATIIRATVGRLLTDQEEGMGVEVENYIACWVEATVDKTSGADAKQALLLGTDFRYHLNGRPVAIKQICGNDAKGHMRDWR